MVALGEGLETGFWRVDNGSVNWLTVELPEMAALRRELLPAAPNLRLDRELGTRRGLDGRGRSPRAACC